MAETADRGGVLVLRAWPHEANIVARITCDGPDGAHVVVLSGADDIAAWVRDWIATIDPEEPDAAGGG